MLLRIPVRELVEFVLRSGDLPSGGAVPGRAQEGTRVHQAVRKERPAEGYRTEVYFCRRVEQDGVELEITGRADGLFTQPGEECIEEIKSVRRSRELDLLGPTDNPLHWGQAQVYAYFHATEERLAAISVQLTYAQFDPDGRLITREQRRDFTTPELTAFFDNLVQRYAGWARRQAEWRAVRDSSAKALAFPFPQYRAGQRELAVAVYRHLAKGRRLFAEAPTGIGKTVSTLFPAIKSLAEGQCERLFYLTAKTSGRALAESTLDEMRRGGLRLKSCSLTAKDKVCRRDGAPCDAETCPLRRGYYDRLNTALEELFALSDAWTREQLLAVASKHQLCPFEFSLDASTSADAIICDYNYVFDPRVQLKRFFADAPGIYAILVDEAHNLPDRAREMFSASLESERWRELEQALRPALPTLAARALAVREQIQELYKQLLELRQKQEAAASGEDAEPAQAADESLFEDEAGRSQAPRILHDIPDGPALVTNRVPRELLRVLRRFSREAEEVLSEGKVTPWREALLQHFFEAVAFNRCSEYPQEACCFYVAATERPQFSVLAKLFCFDPAPLLKEVLPPGCPAVFFSATLTPVDSFARLLGGGEEDGTLRLGSPFNPDHLCVVTAGHIGTSYKQRSLSFGEVAHAIAAAISARCGNYLVFFPSYFYLEKVCAEFQALQLAAVRVLIQSSGMEESQREAFLAQFSHSEEETLVAFAVLGGIFGEGVDLVGERLVGAIIVGVGLPQLSVERELIRQEIERLHAAQKVASVEAEAADSTDPAEEQGTASESPEVSLAQAFEDRLAGRRPRLKATQQPPENQSDEREIDGFDLAYVYPGFNRVLQAAGRVIRSEKDRGIVLLIDPRFSQRRYLDLFPQHWRGQVHHTRATDLIAARFEQFWQRQNLPEQEV